MKLSLKHIAIFGQVKVDMNPVDSNLTNYTTLLDLYKNGWWVTDRFGSIITIVKPRAWAKDGFCCVCRRIQTSINLNTLDLLTQQLADAQYEKYKHFLQSKNKYDKIKKSKEDNNEVYMPSVSSENRNKHNNILRSTQRRIKREI